MSTKDRTYNGWTNYETWAASYWIAEGYAYGVEAVSDRAEELVKEEINRLSFDPRQDAAHILADELESIIEEQINERMSGIPAVGLEIDLFGRAFSAIDWVEIAEHFTADVALPEDYDPEAAQESAQAEQVLA